MFIAFPQQQWLHEHALMTSLYVHCLFYYHLSLYQISHYLLQRSVNHRQVLEKNGYNEMKRHLFVGFGQAYELVRMEPVYNICIEFIA